MAPSPRGVEIAAMVSNSRVIMYILSENLFCKHLSQIHPKSF
ncbi:hypothetical protein SCRDD08_01571 [Streptococcus cristatus]|uniref:Uncharacterized protein n=1 Tax=Streptococcus cristatus TaxID=45634 RepID=A0A139MZK9_STRCR|nr:hypothetical protein SCRDD08_01571 [Streptococcus cristatus]